MGLNIDLLALQNRLQACTEAQTGSSDLGQRVYLARSPSEQELGKYSSSTSDVIERIKYSNRELGIQKFLKLFP